MKQEKLEEFQERLREQRSELLEKILETVDHELELSQDDMADDVDFANVMADKNLNLRLRGRERRLMKKINHALERIEKNEFGKCVSCGEDIGLERLEARPVTTMCIDCKEEEERREKHYSD